MGAVARALLIVLGLLVSIVGIPWGIRQLIRYQLAPQVVAVEGATPVRRWAQFGIGARALVVDRGCDRRDAAVVGIAGIGTAL